MLFCNLWPLTVNQTPRAGTLPWNLRTVVIGKGWFEPWGARTDSIVDAMTKDQSHDI